MSEELIKFDQVKHSFSVQEPIVGTAVVYVHGLLRVGRLISHWPDLVDQMLLVKVNSRDFDGKGGFYKVTGKYRPVITNDLRVGNHMVLSNITSMVLHDMEKLGLQ